MSYELRYGLYHFKNTLFRFCLMILYSIIVVNADIHSEYKVYNLGEDAATTHSFSLTMFAVNILILGFLVAILEFAQFKNRRNLDTWYSLPLDRWKIGVIHFINGAIQLFAAHTISFIWGYIVVAKYIPMLSLDTGAFFKMYLVVFAIGLLFYGMVTFPFMVANNTFDGVVFAAMYIILPYVFNSFLFDGLLRYTGFSKVTDSSYSGGLISVVSGLCDRYSLLFSFKLKKYSEDIVLLKTDDIVWIVFWIFAGIALTVLGILFFNQKQAEKIGGISDSILGYKLLIPLIMFMLVLSTGGEPIIGILYGIVTLILYVVFRRGIKLRIPDIVVIVLVTILANIPVDYVWELSRIIGRKP